MYNYLIPLYWISDLRVQESCGNDYAVAPICFSIESGSGMIISYSFSYGMSRASLHELALLGLREKNMRLVDGIHMYRCTFGDLDLARRKLATDNFRLSLTRHRCPRPCTYDLSKARVLLEHFFYDWDNVFIGGLESFKKVSRVQFVNLLNSVVERFNRALRDGDVCLKISTTGARQEWR